MNFMIKKIVLMEEEKNFMILRWQQPSEGFLIASYCLVAEYADDLESGE